ncbi:MAG: hypothetical protein AAGE01_18685 [Pseudomonadota bacterium]
MKIIGGRRPGNNVQLLLELILALLLLWGAIEAQGFDVSACEDGLSAVAADVSLDPQSIIHPISVRNCQR